MEIADRYCMSIWMILTFDHYWEYYTLHPCPNCVNDFIENLIVPIVILSGVSTIDSRDCELCSFVFEGDLASV